MCARPAELLTGPSCQPQLSGLYSSGSRHLNSLVSADMVLSEQHQQAGLLRD